MIAGVTTLYGKGWEEAKHPRGQPENKGEFASIGVSAQQRVGDDPFVGMQRLNQRQKPTEDGKYIANPIPHAPQVEMDAEVALNNEFIESGMSMRDYIDTFATDENIPLSQLVSGQKIIEVDTAKHFFRNPNADVERPPLVIQYGQYLLMRDGNHRAAAAILRGDDKIKARVLYVQQPKQQYSKDVKSSTEEPIRYAEGDWVSYTGPKGGQGWQNVQTGKVVYGEQPGTKQPSGFPWENEPAKGAGTGSPTQPMQPMQPLGGAQQPQPAEQKPATPAPKAEVTNPEQPPAKPPAQLPQEGEHSKIDATKDAPWTGSATQTPVAPTATPAKPIGDSVAALKQQHTTQQPNGPALDMEKFRMGVHQLVDSHLKSGQQVSLKVGNTSVPIAGVKNGMLVDHKGQTWGTMAIASGDAELQSGPAAQPKPKGVQEGVQGQGGGGTTPHENLGQPEVKPGTTAPQPGTKPVQEPTKTPWQPAGQGLWKNMQTGETVASKEAPGAKTDDILGAARAGVKPQPPKPAAQPGPAKPAQPQPAKPAQPAVDKQLAGHMDSLPPGTTIHGWTKEDTPNFAEGIWSNGQQARVTSQLIGHLGADAIKQHLGQQQAQQPPQQGAGRAQGGAAGQQPPRAYTPQERSTIDSVGNLFGIQPGDIGNDRRHSNFLLRTARMVGFNPDSVTGDRTDKTLAAANFLQSRKAHLESLVQMAQGYGYRGGTARELAHRGRHAGLYLVRAAQARGYQPSGDSEQEQIAGAVQHLQQHEQRQVQQRQATSQAVTQALQHLRARFSGGRFSIWDIALAAIGFYVGYQLVKRFRRGRRRYGQSEPVEYVVAES